MSKDIQIYNGVQPASFTNGIQRHTQTDIITNIIIQSIKNERPVTIDDILEGWFKAPHRHSIRIFSTKGYRYYDPYEKEKIMAECRDIAEERARIWFMSNLGAAIIKGKLLVIPVIQIEESKLLDNA